MTDDNKVLEDLARCSREFRDITGKIDTVDIDVVITNYRKYISHIENDIKRWMLSSKASIINFYSLIKNGDMKNKEICLPDTNYLIHSYQDYYAGLLSYLKEISNIVRKDFNPDKKIELIRKLGLANSKDESFTDLCGEEKDVTFSDAILNIECILDLIETINTFKNDLDELIEREFSDEDVKKACLILFTNSTLTFVNKCIDTVYRTNYKMTDCVNGNETSDENLGNESYSIF